MNTWLLKRFPCAEINKRILFCIGFKICVQIVLVAMVLK